ncbi:MAG TPA: hypothetical protein VK960_07810 [Acidimicrobiia bacterium]|nr:hypothetical protein [Acidimicrobiia bacterium]
MNDHLRPVERRVLAMRASGVSVDQIASAFKRSPGHIGRIIEWTSIPRSGPPPNRKPRALEDRILSLRGKGESHTAIAGRFKKTPGFIKQVEGLAHFRRAHELLSR